MTTATLDNPYETCLEASRRITWTVEDLCGDRRLDFGKRFLPESLARVSPLSFLSEREKLLLNQIRGAGYLRTFIIAETFFLPFVLDHARDGLDRDDVKTQALLGFAEEEAKHMQMFRRFAELFEDGFATPCESIGPPEAVAEAVLAHDPLGVGLAILATEWMTQRHWLEAAKDDDGLDPLIRDMLKHHWMEECQHARMDGLMVEEMASRRDAEGIEAGVDAYFAVGTFLDEGLQQQVRFDLSSLERASGRRLSDDERARFVEVQTAALRWTFLGSGMTHPAFLAVLGGLTPGGRTRVEDASQAFC